MRLAIRAAAPPGARGASGQRQTHPNPCLPPSVAFGLKRSSLLPTLHPESGDPNGGEPRESDESGIRAPTHQRGSPQEETNRSKNMNSYQPSVPRAALVVAAIALTALTIGAAVVVPVMLDPGVHETGSLANQMVVAPTSATIVNLGRIEVRAC